MTLSLCKHSFPVQPPAGSIVHPGDCTGCGITYLDRQAELDAQEERVRLGTAARGRCEGCRIPDRMLFTLVPEPRPWHGFGDDAPANLRLCTPCWSAAKQADEAGEPITFTDAFNHGSDEQLLAFLGWGS
ncbi:hypothetical protein ACFVY4_26955 [Streptomyces sp. NPDC058299]|uniref:hypothetical protein n=1 Tax=Streptomyces sp. NPDC058299 TaxID=3346435 RepID=UPI0036E51EE0